MKLLGTWNEDHHKLFNLLVKQGFLPCEIEKQINIDRVYVVPDNFKGTALDWERRRNRGEL